MLLNGQQGIVERRLSGEHIGEPRSVRQAEQPLNPWMPCSSGILPVAIVVHRIGESVGTKVERCPYAPRPISARKFGHLPARSNGRIAAIEILKSTLRTRDYVEKGEGEGKTLLDAMRDSSHDGMQHFDGEIEKLIRDGVIDFETGMTFATNPGNLRLEMADYIDENIKQKPERDPAAAQDSELELTS